MQIFLRKLTLENFKGIRNLHIDFTEEVTNIYGKNATGKSTIADAFMWLLFHKNTDDKSDFSIKTLDSNNRAIPKIDHSVKAILEVDGIKTEFCKVYREKWEVENGDTEEKFRGHESKCFVDGVPVSKGEYDKRVQAIVHSDIFKLVTNPLYFCSAVKWQDRRKTLFELSPNITNEDIIAENEELFNPLTEILQKYEIEAYKKKLKSSISKIQDNLDEIPARIDEAFKSMPDEVDSKSIQLSIGIKEAELTKLDKQLTDVSVLFEDYNKEKQKIFRLKTQQNELSNTLESNFQKAKYQEKNRLDELKRELEELKKYKTSKESLVESTENALKEKHEIRETLRKDWHSKNEEMLEIKEDSFICPTCRRALEEHDIEEKKMSMISNFDNEKIKILSSISNKGKEISTEINNLESRLSTAKESLKTNEIGIQEKEIEIKEQKIKMENIVQKKAEDVKEYQELQEKIEFLQENFETPQINTDEITAEKSKINTELDNLKKQLVTAEIIVKTKKRITELGEQEQELAIIKANYQKELQMCDAFTKYKIDKMEGSINGLFKYVKFKLFEEQVNGGEKECCEVLIDGVPYADANNASKINAGLDVINAISKFYGVAAPIFIDNRESVNDLIECESQIINLFVTIEDEKLRVEVA